MAPGQGEIAGTILGIQPRFLILVVVSALGYAIATIGMKLASTSMAAVAMGVIVLGFVVATLAEISLLRNADLGVIYITIVGVETLMVLGFATLIGEGLDLRRVTGAGFVVAGIALVSH